MEKGIFPLQTELHDSLMPPLPAARRHHSQWHHGAGPGHTLLPEQHHRRHSMHLAAWKSPQTRPLQPRIPVRDHPSLQAPPPHELSSPVPCSDSAVLSRAGRRGCSRVLLVPRSDLRAAASRAGQAGCRAGPVCGGSAAVGAGSSSRGSAAGRGAAGKCAASEPQAPARDPASVGRYKSEQSDLPQHPAVPLCCRADAETHGLQCVHQVLNLRV